MVFRTRGHFLGQVSYMHDQSNMTMSGIKQDKRELSTPTRPNLSYKYRLKLAQASMAIAKDFSVTLCPSLNGTLDGRTLRAASPAGQPPAREACEQLALAWTARGLQG